MAKVIFEFNVAGQIEHQGNTGAGVRVSIQMADCSPEGKAGPHDALANIILAMAPEILEKASAELIKSFRDRGLNAKGELFSYDPCTTRH